MKRRLRRTYYFGSRYECNLCHATCRDWILAGIDSPIIAEAAIVGGGSRKTSCPNCLAKDRARLIYLYLVASVQLFEQMEPVTVLHVAPDKGLREQLMTVPNVHYVCGDKFMDGYKYPPYTTNIDITNLTMANDHFDLIICSHVLEHILDDRKAMRELWRVLKPAGRAILQVPISLKYKETVEDSSITEPQERLATFGQRDHVRIYGQDYGEQLERCGFDVEVFNAFEDFPIQAARYGLNPLEGLYVGVKRPNGVA